MERSDPSPARSKSVPPADASETTAPPRSGNRAVRADTPDDARVNGEPSEEPASPNGLGLYFQRLWPHVSENLTVILAGLATLVISLRVLYIARFDLSVALAIVQAGGAATVLGIVLQLLPTVIGFAAAGWAALFFLPPIGVDNHWDAFTGGVSIVVALFIAPLYVLLIVAALTVALLLLTRGGGTTKEKAVAEAPALPETESASTSETGTLPPWVTGIGAVLATLAVGQLLVTTAMWLPAERMVVHEESIVGYDIRSEAGWTTILVQRDSSVHRVPTRTISARVICNVEEPWLWDRPVHALLVSDVTPLC